MYEYKEHAGINNNNNNNEKWTKKSLVDCPNLYNQLNRNGYTVAWTCLLAMLVTLQGN